MQLSSDRGLARRAILCLVCLVVAACAAPGSSPPPAATTAPAATAARAMRKVSLVIPNLSFYAVPVMLAQHKGYFADEGYELDVAV